LRKKILIEKSTHKAMLDFFFNAECPEDAQRALRELVFIKLYWVGVAWKIHDASFHKKDERFCLNFNGFAYFVKDW
jgi:hypothetical protein